MTLIVEYARVGTAMATDQRSEGLVSEWLRYLAEFRSYSPRTIESYAADLRLFVAFVGPETHPATVTKQAIVAYTQTLSGGGATKARRIAALRSFWNYLEWQEIVSTNPVRGLPMPRRRQALPEVLSMGDVDALILSLRKTAHRVAVWLMAGCGLRLSEALNLRRGDVDLQHNAVLVRHGKGDKDRAVPLSEPVAHVLAGYMGDTGGRPDDLLLPGHDRDRPYNKNTLGVALHRAARKAGLDPSRVHPHVLRHTFGTELIRRGVDIATVRDLMGHASIQTTGRYLHSDQTTKRKAVATLWA